MSISNYLEEKILNKICRNVDFTVTTVYIALSTADPGETGDSEVTGGSYARKSITFNAAANPGGTISNSADILFVGMPAVTVTHVCLWDALTSGNPLWSGALTASKTLNEGDSFQLIAGSVTATLG